MKFERDTDLEELDLTIEKKNDEQEMEEARESAHKKGVLRETLNFSIYILLVFLFTFLIVKYVGQRTVVLGSSMEPTLQDKDNLIVDKISYIVGEPERFDIVVFPFAYEEKTYYIKRVIGLPGETVRIDYLGNIYINEVLLEENYGAEVIEDPGIAFNGVTLGNDEYFVLGDNRNHSSDSRFPAVGKVKKQDLIGRAWVRIYPFNKMSKVSK